MIYTSKIHYIVDSATKKKVARFESYEDAVEFLENQSHDYRCSHHMENAVYES